MPVLQLGARCFPPLSGRRLAAPWPRADLVVALRAPSVWARAHAAATRWLVLDNATFRGRHGRPLPGGAFAYVVGAGLEPGRPPR